MNANEHPSPMSGFRNNPLDTLRRLPVNRFVADSRQLERGDVFVCRQGLQVDSHDFVEEAVRRGAIAVMSQRPVDVSVPQIVTAGFSVSLTLISQFYQYPQDRLFNIGVTGTNGKTTVAFGLQQLLNRYFPTAYTGTLGCRFGNWQSDTTNTTPDAITLLALCKQIVDAGITHHVMEVSSHALDQGRVSCVNFDIIIVTNIREDHLDYHGSRCDYIDAKLRLVDRLKPGGLAIVNRDDPASSAILDRCRGKARVLTFGSDPSLCDITLSAATSSLEGAHYTITHQHTEYRVNTPLPFRFNIENSLAILAALSTLCGNMEESVALLAQLPPVPGRCEITRLPNRSLAVIDYAHNRDGLKNLIGNIRSLTRGRIITVIGVTGDRLHEAEEIGRICSNLSECSIFTTDNPMGVDPELISERMATGAQNRQHLTELDRQSAIKLGLSQMNGGDILLICGKGRERFQYQASDKKHRQFYPGDHNVLKTAIGKVTNPGQLATHYFKSELSEEEQTS